MFFCISVSWQAFSTTLRTSAGPVSGHVEKKDFMSVIKASRTPELERYRRPSYQSARGLHGRRGSCQFGVIFTVDQLLGFDEGKSFIQAEEKIFDRGGGRGVGHESMGIICP